MPLVSLPGYPARELPAPAPATTAPPAGRQGPDLSSVVESLRLSDARFHGIQPKVRGSVVYLRGTVFRWEHLHDLAKLIANLRGVERVVLEDVHADSN